MKYIKIIVCIIVLFLTCSVPAWGIDKSKQLDALADSSWHLVGKNRFITVNEQFYKLAVELKDTVRLENAQNDLFNHYYNRGETDSLRTVCYELMAHYASRKNENARYQIWRQYIQRLTENGKQDQAIAETELLSKDAEQNHSKYGQACSEMCVGYNHRVFSNNVKLCLEYYANAWKIFQENHYYEDGYIVCLNIVQIYLARQEYTDVNFYLNQLEKLAAEIKRTGDILKESLYIRFLQFKVIATLAQKGEKAAVPYIVETDSFYFKHPHSVTRDAWLGYKILCARTLNDVDETLLYLDSLLHYHQSIGACYPSNLLFKAQCLRTVGRLDEACQAYADYAQLNDSVRSAELDEQLSKYTVQFDVDKLNMDKLELEAEINHNRLVTVVVVCCFSILLLIILAYYYMRTLSMNKQLDAANKAVIKASRIKSSFIQHITHEIRTPLNSIVGFSSLIAMGELDADESKEYAAQIENSNAYLLDLVNNVIDIADMDSHAEDAPKELVDVNLCCEACVESLRPLVKEAIALEYIPSPEQLTVRAVNPWVKRVLMTLLNNAVKFTDSGFIRLRCEGDKAAHLVRFIVEDSGIGIDEQHKDSIFQRFMKLDSFSPGTGLGLAVAKQIIEIVDGKIYLDTSYTGGARFVVEWPIG